MILLDTHAVVWLADDPDRLSRRATIAIRQAYAEGGGLAISVLTLFELAQLAARHRIRFDSTIDDLVQEVEDRFVVLPVTGKIAAMTAQLPDRYPRDPVDRIIGATALLEGLPLVTADAAIQKSKVVKTIW